MFTAYDAMLPEKISEPKVLIRNRRHTTGDIESSDDTLDTSGEEDNKDVSTVYLLVVSVL